MKKVFIIAFLSSFILISCSDDTSSKETNNNINMKSSVGSEFVTKEGRVLGEHPIFKALMEQEKYSLSQADELYRKYASSDVNSNVKNFGFRLLMDKGLLEDGTSEQKKFYIDEQLKINSNLPSFENFYLLLFSANKFMSKEEMLSKGAQFYEKNLKVIENNKWPTEERKKEKEIKLKKHYKIFTRRVNLIK